MERAERVESDRNAAGPSSGSRPVSTDQDLQALIDGLRAEIAELRSELQRYRNRGDHD